MFFWGVGGYGHFKDPLWFLGKILVRWSFVVAGEILEVLFSDSCKNIPTLASMPVIYRNVHFTSSVFIYAVRMLDFHFGTTYTKGHFNHNFGDLMNFSISQPCQFTAMPWSPMLQSVVMVLDLILATLVNMIEYRCNNIEHSSVMGYIQVMPSI